MSGITRLPNQNLENLGLDAWGNRDIIPSDMNEEVTDGNSVFPDGTIPSAKIKNLRVATITLTNAGYIRGGQTAYDTGTGFWMGYDSTAYKFSLGDSSGNKLTWDGSTLSITGTVTATTGTIGGFSLGTDYIRDAANSFGLASTVTAGDDVRFWSGSTFANRATAPFRVYESGKAVVSSLNRSDFQFTTLFESLDGFTKTNTTLYDIDVILSTAASTGSTATLYKQMAWSPSYLTWNKDRKIRTKIQFNNIANQIIYIIVGDINTKRHFGFRIANATLTGSMADGTTRENVTLTTLPGATSIELEARFKAGVGCDFYVGGSYVGELHTNIPTGDTDAFYLINLYVYTDENVSKSIQLSYWDFWQAA